MSSVRTRYVAIGGLVALAALAAPAAHASQATSKDPHLLRPRTMAAPAAADVPLINGGGPVQSAPKVYVDYWGWPADPSNEQPYLNEFLTSVGGSPWLATVNQYGGGSPSTLLAGVWSDPAAVPASPSDAQIQAEAVNAANHFNTGTGVNVQIVVATPSGHSTPGFGTQFCAYHGAVAALPNVTYTDLPYMTDAGGNCGENIVNSGATGTLDGVSIVEGHELAETITDPLLNAWVDANSEEIGDKCAWTGLDDLNLSGASFAVQPLWSNAANACVSPTGPVTSRPDFNGDHRTDIAITGVAGWQSLPVAFSNGDGNFNVTNVSATSLAAMASTPHVRELTGDFNGDGRSDIAFVGGVGWNTVPVAFSNGDGSFNLTNLPAPNLAAWAATPDVRVLTGDFNGDGRTDIAMVGGVGWATVPVGFSNGDGTFNVTNLPVTSLPAWTQMAGVRVLTGDFNGDGRTDIAVTGGFGWATVPVAFSNGNGTFNVTNLPVSSVPVWSTEDGATLVTGDFNGDHRTDIAITGVAGWESLPVAFSDGDGTFTVANVSSPNVAKWTATLGATVVAGDFNGDGRTDIAITAGIGWASVPVAFSNGDGSFNVTNANAPNIAGWTVHAGATVVAGDFNGDGRTDMAITGGIGWNTVPVAFSNGDGTFNVTNLSVPSVPTWTTLPGARIL